MDIIERIEDVNARIKRAAEKSGRKRNDILLVAVSKVQSIEKIKEAQVAGLNVFGENKVQELIEKYPLIDNASWHLIGHLQRNKVKYIIDKVKMIHSIDSIELLDEINKRMEQMDKKMPVLIQINIGKEESKSGIFEEEIMNFIEAALTYKNIVINGLMTVPPRVDNSEEARIYFKKMKCLFDRVKSVKGENLDFKYLSMGMTHDFEVAIEEGANIIRVGTGIFGERNY